MANEQNLTVVAKDQHSVNIYTSGDGVFKGTLFITTGTIIGQPINNGDSFTITYNEGGFNYMNTYKLPGLQFKSKIKL